MNDHLPPYPPKGARQATAGSQPPWYLTVRGVVGGIVALVVTLILINAAVGDDGRSDGIGEARRQAILDRANLNEAGEDEISPRDDVDLDAETVGRLALDLTWNNMTGREREELCSAYDLFGPVTSHEMFVAGYGDGDAPSLRMFRGWAEKSCPV